MCTTPSGGRSTQAEGQVGGKVRGIVSGAIDEGGFASAHERQAHDVHPRRRHDTAVVADASLAIEHRNIEPRIVWTIACGPNHGFDASIIEVHAEPDLRVDLRRFEAMRWEEAILLPARQ